MAGYGDANSTAKAANLSLVVLDAVNQSVVAVAYTSPPLGAYSYDDYKGYSPPVGANVTVDVPNARALLLAVRVDNNERNLQILLPSLSLSATWSDKAGPEPPAPASNFTSPPADAAVVRRGPLLYALHPHENTVVTKRYDDLLPDRPQAVDYEIGTDDPWATRCSSPTTLRPPPASNSTRRPPPGGRRAARSPRTPTRSRSPRARRCCRGDVGLLARDEHLRSRRRRRSTAAKGAPPAAPPGCASASCRLEAPTSGSP